MEIRCSNRNFGRRNPRVPVNISGQDGEGSGIGATVWFGIGVSGAYQGVGFHTTITDAKRVRAELDKAIKIAEGR